MNRRDFILLGAIACCTPGAARAAYQATEYEWGMRGEFRASGQTVIYNFRSSWSLTCQIKEGLLADLKAENTDYRNIRFIDVDYDMYGPSQWVEQLNVRRRSTLVAIKGETEIARIENLPYKFALQGLLDAALAA